MLATLLALREDITLTVDSGAFTAYKLGKKIELEGYMNFLATSKLNIEHYMSLDVIGDVQESKKNYYKMLDEGFKPMPVFTRGAPSKDLEEYYETSDVVAIGGLVGTKGRGAYIAEVMKIVRGRKVHWLGLANLDLLKKHKPYSCDSSSYSGAQRFGNCSIYKGDGELETLTSGDKRGLARLSIYIQKLGYNPALLLEDASWRNSIPENTSLCISLASYLKYASDIKANIGTKYHFAVSPTGHLKYFLKLINEKNSNNFEWRA